MAEQFFQRAKSMKNKEIRLQEIMERADYLFNTCSYHEITLSMIASELGIGRSALYKYVSSKEEIYLSIITKKQKELMDDISSAIKSGEKSITFFSETAAHMIHQHIDFIKYFSILTTILETNVSLDVLVSFKKNTYEDSRELLSIIQEITHISDSDVFRFFLSILHQAVCLKDLIYYSDSYSKAMKILNIPVQSDNFERELADFIHIYALHFHQYYRF